MTMATATSLALPPFLGLDLFSEPQPQSFLGASQHQQQHSNRSAHGDKTNADDDDDAVLREMRR